MTRNTAELVDWAAANHRRLVASGRMPPDKLPALPRIEWLGVWASVDLMRVQHDGREWMEATCPTR